MSPCYDHIQSEGNPKSKFPPTIKKYRRLTQLQGKYESGEGAKWVTRNRHNANQENNGK